MFSYRTLFKQAWLITWRHKYLWFFGLFAAIVAGSGSWEYQIFSQSLNQGLIEGSYARLYNIVETWDLFRNFWLGIGNLINYDIWTILSALSLLILVAILATFFIWLAISSQAALVGEVKKILTPRKKPSLSIREALSDGHGHFWALCGLNILIKFLVTLAFFIVGLPLLFMAWRDTNVLAVVYAILFVIFIPVAVSLSLMVKYAIAYRVLENKSALASLEAGEKLFRKNWLVSVEAAVILFIINFLASVVLIIFLSIFLLPLFALALIFNSAGLATAVLLAAIAVVIVFGSALTTFQVSSWTNLFVSLSEKGGQAKLERLFARRAS